MLNDNPEYQKGVNAFLDGKDFNYDQSEEWKDGYLEAMGNNQDFFVDDES
jgi:hypothetical protein